MAHNQQSAIKFELPSSSSMRGTEAMARAAQTNLQSQRSPTAEERQIAGKLQQHIAKQIGYAAKGAHGEHLAQILSIRTIQFMDEFIAYDRSVREKPRDMLDQADMEAFCQEVRQAHANSLLFFRTSAVEQIEAQVNLSLEPEGEKKPKYIVEYDPGFLGRLFGGQRTTKVLYDYADEA